MGQTSLTKKKSSAVIARKDLFRRSKEKQIPQKPPFSGTIFSPNKDCLHKTDAKTANKLLINLLLPSYIIQAGKSFLCLNLLFFTGSRFAFARKKHLYRDIEIVLDLFVGRLGFATDRSESNRRTLESRECLYYKLLAVSLR